MIGIQTFCQLKICHIQIFSIPLHTLFKTTAKPRWRNPGSSPGLGTTEEKEVTDYHFDIVTSFLFVGTLTELLGNISVDS